MTDISESQTSKTRTLTPLPWGPGEKIDFGACRSIKVTCVSEIGWADNRDMMQDISSGGGPKGQPVAHSLRAKITREAAAVCWRSKASMAHAGGC